MTPRWALNSQAYTVPSTKHLLSSVAVSIWPCCLQCKFGTLCILPIGLYLFAGQKCMLTARHWSYCPTWWMVMPDLPWMDCRWLWRPREPTLRPQMRVAPLMGGRHTPTHPAGVWWPQRMLKKGCSDHTFSTIKQVGFFCKASNHALFVFLVWVFFIIFFIVLFYFI